MSPCSASVWPMTSSPCPTSLQSRESPPGPRGEGGKVGGVGVWVEAVSISAGLERKGRGLCPSELRRLLCDLDV